MCWFSKNSWQTIGKIKLKYSKDVSDLLKGSDTSISEYGSEKIIHHQVWMKQQWQFWREFWKKSRIRMWINVPMFVLRTDGTIQII